MIVLGAVRVTNFGCRCPESKEVVRGRYPVILDYVERIQEEYFADYASVL